MTRLSAAQRSGRVVSYALRVELSAMFYITCDRCLVHLGFENRDAALAAGWIPKRPDNGEGYGWKCPGCVGQPIIVRRRGQSKSRVGA